MINKRKVSFYGIDRFFNEHKAPLTEIFQKTGQTGKFLMSQQVRNFEEELATFCGRKYAVTTSSCTDALYFALKAANVKSGDEVIVPSFSFIATVTPVLQIGAVPVFTDILPDTLSMDFEDVKKKITSKTKAIIFVHLYGTYCPLTEISQLASNNNISLIEDNAHSLGSISKNNLKAGTEGLISCVSFDPTKIIGGFGTAGCLLTDDSNIYKKTSVLRNQGKNTESGLYEELGSNSRISSFQAAFLSYQLNQIQDFINRRGIIASFYNSVINTLDNIDYVQKSESTFHKYVIFTEKRAELSQYLKENGIETMIHYDRALFEHKLFKKFNHKAQNINVVHSIKNKVLSLPIYPEMKDDEVEYVAKIIKNFVKKIINKK